MLLANISVAMALLLLRLSVNCRRWLTLSTVCVRLLAGDGLFLPADDVELFLHWHRNSLKRKVVNEPFRLLIGCAFPQLGQTGQFAWETAGFASFAGRTFWH